MLIIHLGFGGTSSKKTNPQQLHIFIAFADVVVLDFRLVYFSALGILDILRPPYSDNYFVDNGTLVFFFTSLHSGCFLFETNRFYLTDRFLSTII